MADPEKIVLERAQDGERWRITVEGGDTEGHMPIRYRDPVRDAEGHSAPATLTLEPDGEDENGEPLFRMTGEDAEGHVGKYRF